MSKPILTKITKLFFGDENEKILKRYFKIVDQINAFEDEIKQLKDEDFPQRTAILKEKAKKGTRFKITERSLFKLESELSSDSIWKQLNSIKNKVFLSQEELFAEIEKRVIEEEVEEIKYGAKRYIEEDTSNILDEILPEAFALVREASIRTLDQRHYDVQMVGGIALHEGNIAEMQTGEGKTLASTCPSYLNALPGNGVHIVTPNEYLAKRDSEWMGAIYKFLGLTVGLIQHHYSPNQRQVNYACDITYGTNNEYGFDYLRDNMKTDLAEYVQRDFHYGIIDEVDSILIDESRTPLIISGATDDNVEKYKQIDKFVYGLDREIQKSEVMQLAKEESHHIDEDWQEKEERDVVREGDYVLDEKSRSVSLTERGALKIEKRLHDLDRYQLTERDVNLLETEINDESLIKTLNKFTSYEFKKEDSFLHALSEKLEEASLNKHKLSILKLAYKGMLLPTYRLMQNGVEELEEISEFEPIINQLKSLKDLEYETEEAYKEAVRGTIGEAETEKYFNMILPHLEIAKSLFDRVNTSILHHVNQALKAHLVFKRDVDYVVQNGKVVIVDDFTGRLMDGRRYSDGLHQALEAKERVGVEMESQTLASITFQNYFRLYKKIAGMTGTAETEKDEFKKIYNLGVVMIPTHRLLMRTDHSDVIYKSDKAKYDAIVSHVQELNEKQQPVLVGTVSVETSELISQQLKQKGVDHRVLNAKFHEQEAEIIKNAGQLGAVTIATNMAGRGTDIQPPKEVLKLGGLFILGTERHDSRRIDNQLRGRSGRQGDPGESQFFLSMEDNLLRIFGGERLIKWMDRLQLEEDIPIEHVFVTKAIANAQKKIEGIHFSARKNLLEYDDVMERQRSIIYEKRRAILSDEIHHSFLDMCAETIDILMDEFCDDKFQDQWNRDGFANEFFHTFNVHLDDEWKHSTASRDEIIQDFFKETENYYQTKIDHFREDFDKEYNEEKLYEVIALYLHLSMSQDLNHWEFPHPAMKSLHQFVKGWLEQFQIYAQQHSHSNQGDMMAEFFDKNITGLQKSFLEKYKDFKQEFFETLLLIVQRQTLLMSIDEKWKNNLQAMDHLREEVGLAGYAQKKPIDEYRKKAFAMFEELITAISQDSVTQFFHKSSLPHPRYLFFSYDPRLPEETYNVGPDEDQTSEQTQRTNKANTKKRDYVSNRDRKKKRTKRHKTA